MKKYVNGKYIELTSEEIAAMQLETERAQLAERSRPLTESEISRMFLRQNINTLITDDATASRAVEFHPEMKYDGALIPAGSRINWKGKLKRASVNIWDSRENDPDNAPALWEDICYKDGFRIIPEVIPAALAFSAGEPGWWQDVLYRSKVDANVYTPEAYPDHWEEAWSG